MENIWQKLNRPIIALSPMAGWTDSPMRQISREFGADLTYSEMISADGVYYDVQPGSCKQPSLKLAEFTQSERPIILQIFGNDPEKMAFAAEYLAEKFKPDGLDLNMGCPARKVNKNFHGASLIKNPELASEIIREIKKRIDLPLSAKTRLGWNDSDEIFEFAQSLEGAGLDALAIHGRTKTQEYRGSANHEAVIKLKEKLKIPLLISGDMFSSEEIVSLIKSFSFDGVLIARGSMGNPWIFQQIKQGLGAKEVKKPSLDDIHQTVLKHARLMIQKEGDLIEFRKHLIHYYKGFPRAKLLRSELLTVVSLEDLEQVIKRNIAESRG